MRKLGSLLFGFLFSICVSAQGDGIPYLDFSLQISSNNVVVSWIVKSGNTCEDVEVWRGTDSLNMESIYTYPGICGDNDSDKVYSYTDTPPLSGIHYYYRVVVITDRTEIRKVLVPPRNGLNLFPNPASEAVNFVFDPQNELRSIEVYNSKGGLVERLTEPGNPIQIDLTAYKPGTYYYRAVFSDREQINRFIKY